MREAFSRYRFILRYAYALPFAAVAVAVAFGALLYVSQASYRTTLERITHYHMPSGSLTDQMLANVQSLVQFLNAAAVQSSPALAKFPGRSHPTVDANGILFAMRENLAQLEQLHAERGHHAFTATLLEIVERFSGVANGIENETSSAQTGATINSLNLSLQQMARLHAIAAADYLSELEKERSRTSPFLATLVFTSLVGALLIAYLVYALRAAVVRQASTEEALSASRERVFHMQKMDAMGQLVGGVAHDFNNLLTAIIGQTSLLQMRPDLDPQTAGSLDDVQQAARQAASLTQQLLSFSRRQTVEPRVIALNDLLANMESMLRRVIGEDVELSFEYEPAVRKIELDPGQAEQVVMNFAVNARDAMPEGGLLTIRTDNVDIDRDMARVTGVPEGHWARLTVMDTGTGMDRETCERLFEPFFTTKPIGHGVGLGLSTVHGVVTRAGGHIQVESCVGAGTRFEVFLPESDAVADSAPARAECDAVTPAGGNETILVVEDEAQIRRFLEKGLSDLGYRVISAADGRQAMTLYSKNPAAVDLIVTDVIMPNMNGPEFLEQARTLRPNVGAIFMSGYAADKLDSQRESMSDVPILHKPFEIFALARLIRRLLDERRVMPHSNVI